VFDDFLVVQMSGLEDETRSLESTVTDERAELREKGPHQREVRLILDALDAQHHFHLDRWLLIELLVDVPTSVRGLAPRWPVEGDVGDHAWRESLTRKPVAGFPGDVTQHHVDLEVLFERLTLEKGAFESVT